MSQRIAVSLVVLGLFVQAKSYGATEDNDPHAVGCVPPKAEQRAWERRHLIVTKKVRLNQLGLQRVNDHRTKQGRAALKAAEVRLAPMGAETEGATEEQLAAAPAVPADTGAPAADAPAALPAYVDNSTLKYFPPVRSQGSIATCAQWSAMYYCYTHMNAMARDLDVKAGGAGNDNYIFSPKFTYNQVNGGSDSGSWMTDGWSIAQKHGCAVWSDWPYDSDYRGWALTANVWRNAINYRTDTQGSISSVDTSPGLNNVKTYLVNGYILSFATNIYAWQFKTIGNDPSTSADDAFLGKYACYWLDSGGGGHAMTAVGYNDDIWIDINGNGVVDAGEKGALRIVNSWGTGWCEGGFTWLAYDALKPTSAVNGGPSASRQAAWWSNEAYWVTAKATYTPKVLAEFQLNHLKRNQLRMSLGIADTSATTPSTTWYTNTTLGYAGGAYAFNGGTSAVDGTFVLDFTDIMSAAGQTKRWFLGMYDSTAGDVTTLKSFRVINVGSGADAVCAAVPKTADAAQAYAWVDWAYNAGTNTAPTITSIANQTTNEDTATAAVPFTVGDAETSAASLVLTRTSGNQTLAPLANIFGGSGANRTVTVTPGANQSGTTTITVIVIDGGGLTAQTSFTLTVNPVNDAPVANAPSVTLAKNASKAITLTASDAEGNSLTYGVVANPAHGALSGTAPNLTYTPTTDYAGADSFTFRAYDGKLYSTTATVSITVTQPEMVAHWKLDETNGTVAADSSGHDNIVTLVNGPAWTTGKLGGALSFNGSNYCVSASNAASLNPTSQITLALWLNAPAYTYSGMMLSKDYNAQYAVMWYGLTGRIRFDLWPWFSSSSSASNGQFVSNKVLTLNEWHHVACTFDGVNAKIYVDGMLDKTSVPVSGTLSATNNPIYLGCNGGINFPYKGKLDDVRVYNCALSAAEVAALAGGSGNTVPTISDITDKTINEDANTDALAFTVGDAQTAAASLTVTGNSSNTTLVPNANIVFGGSGANRTVAVTPAANQTGSATISVTVTDGGGLTAQDSFVLTVNAVNDAPVITSGPTASPNPAQVAQTVTFTAAASDADGDTPTYAWAFGDGTNGSGASASHAYSAAGTFTATVTVSDGKGGTVSGNVAVTVASSNTAPTISDITNKTINEDTNTGALFFSVGDAQTAAASLTVTGSSSNTTLVPNANTVFGGSGANRTVTVTPAANQNGTATITVTVSDGSLTTSDTFVLTVTAVNDAPTISDIANRSISANTSTGAIAFTVGDVETAATSLTISGSSSNTTLVPNANIVFGGSGTSRTVTVTPAASQTGSATITVTVSDGGLTASDAFVLTVNALPTYTITASAGTGGTITPSGMVTVNSGASQTFTIAANAEYAIADVTVDGASVGAVASYTFSNVTANHTIAASFAAANALVAHWKLDETNGTVAADSSGRGNTVTLVNGPAWTTGKLGGALSFNGSNYCVSASNAASLNPTSQITLALWLNAPAYTYSGMMLSKNYNVQYAVMWYGSTGRIRFDLWPWFSSSSSASKGQFVSNKALTLNEWHHVACTFDGVNAKIYVDGMLDKTSVPVSGTLSATNNPIYLGCNGGVNFPYKGKLDDVRVYNRALSAAEVAALAGGSGNTASARRNTP